MKILNCITLSWISWLATYLIFSFIYADFDIKNWEARVAFVGVSIVLNTLVFLAAFDLPAKE